MGTVHTAINGVGSPPRATGVAWRAWADRLGAARLSECPIARVITKYIRYDAAGNGSGGTGAGTFASPWLCASPAHISTLIAAVGAAFMSFQLAEGDTWCATNGGTGISIAIPNITVTSYRPSGSTALTPPSISGFKAAYGGSGWTQHPTQTNLYYRTETNNVYWVREDDDPDHAIDRLTTATSLATLNGAANAGKWVIDRANTYNLGANTLVMHSRASGGAAPPSTTQVALASGAGVLVTDVDGVRVHNLRADGWGMSSSGNQTYTFQSSAAGTSSHIFSDCVGYWGPRHVAGHLGAGTTGGFTTWINCRFGLCMIDAGGSSVFVAYSAGGAHELYTYGLQITHGGLIDETNTTGREAWASHVHTGDPAYTVSVAVMIGTRGPRKGTRNAVFANSTFAQAPAMAGRDDIGAIRCFVADEWFEEIKCGGSGMGLYRDCARINSWLRICAQGGMSSIGMDVLVGGDGSGNRGLGCNNTYIVDTTTASGATDIALFNHTVVRDGHHEFHSDYVMVDSGISTYFGYGGDGTTLLKSVFVNCREIRIGSGGGSTISNIGRNQTPDSDQGAGGHSGTLSFGIRTADFVGYSGLDNTQNWSPQTGLGSCLGEPQESVVGTGVHPNGWVVDYDRFWRVRRPQFRSPGPVEYGTVKRWYRE